MTTLRALLDRRATITTELRSMVDSAPEGALAPDVEARFNTLRAEADTLQARIDRQAVVDDMERRAASSPLGGTGDSRLDSEVARVGLIDAIRAQMGATDGAAGRAREVSAELARRSGRSPQGILWSMGGGATEQRTTTSTGTGAGLIATNLDANAFIQRLYAQTRVRQLGATVLSGLTGNLDVPRLSASTTSGWVAEGSALTLSDATFDKVSLRPRHAGVLTEVSRNMLMQSTPDVETLLRNDMARVLAVTLDSAAIAGTGTGNAPTGILNTAGIGSAAIGSAGGALTYESVLAVMGGVQDQNAEQGALAFLSNYKVKRAAADLKTTYNQPLGLDVVFQGMPQAYTTSVPSNLTKSTATNLSALIYGNWSDLLIGLWSELDVLVNPYVAPSFAAGAVQIRAMLTCDVNVRHPASFAAIQDIAA